MSETERVINDLQDAVNDDWIWEHADYYALTMKRALALLKEQEEQIERLEHDLAVAQDDLHYYINGND